MQNQLRPDVVDTVDKLARQTRGDNYRLKRNEQANFKADLINFPEMAAS